MEGEPSRPGPSNSRCADTQIFFIDEVKFAELSAEISPEAAQTLLNILRNLMAQWSVRAHSYYFKNTVLRHFLRKMMLHGVPMEVDWSNPWLTKTPSVEAYNMSLMPSYEFVPRRNITSLFEDISRLEDEFRWDIWKNMQKDIHAKKHGFYTGNFEERGQILHLVRTLNYRGMATQNSYSRFTRMRYRRAENMPMMHAATLCSLQTILASERLSDVDVSEKLFKFAENCVKNLTTVKDCFLFAYLSEIMISLLVLDDVDTAAAVAGIEAQCDKRAKYYKHLRYFQPYRRLIAYLMLEKNIGNLVIDPQIVAEDLEDQLRVLEDGAASVFVEAAIRLYATMGFYDQLMNCVARYVKKVPRRAKGVIEFLQSTEFAEEADVVIDHACDQIEKRMHPSEELWVSWCEKRLERPTRYGPLVEVYASCTKVLFQFLDFGQNRTNERAWRALYFVIQNVDRDTITPLWAERSSWWLAFHHDGINLSRSSKKCRDVIFKALREELRS